MNSDDFDFVKNLSKEQKQRLIEKLIGEPEPEPKTKPTPKTQDGSFTTSIKKDKQEGEIFGVPVTEMPRFNKFEDDGSDHKDKQNATPDVELTERRRPPFKKITQTCTRCDNTVETHPQFYREFYICDRCLKK
jgi:hypothetical protein